MSVRNEKDLDSTNKRKVFEAIKEKIHSGSYKSEQQLRIGDLAKEFNVSQTPVREALIQLEGEGLVSFRPYKGAVVKGVSCAEMKEIFEIRVALESIAIKHAIPNLTEAVLVKAQKITSSMRETNDPLLLSRLNWEFHSVIYSQSQMPLLCEMVDTLWLKVDRYSRMYYAVDFDQFERDHQQQLEAYLNKDVSKAIKLLEEHMGRVMAILIRLLPE
ncbi:GntR family transcriptional regulator [Aminobacterium colombiense]